MALLYTLDINTAYDFRMNSPAILGAEYKNSLVLGLLDYSSAILIENVGAIHASVLSDLPVGTPSDPTLLIYVKIRSSTGNIRVFALDWISEQPISSEATTITVMLSNVTPSRIPIIRAALLANGFNSFTITQ